MACPWSLAMVRVLGVSLHRLPGPRKGTQVHSTEVQHGEGRWYCLLGRGVQRIATNFPWCCLKSPNRRATIATQPMQGLVEFVKLWVERGQERVDSLRATVRRSSSIVPWSNLPAILRQEAVGRCSPPLARRGQQRQVAIPSRSIQPVLGRRRQAGQGAWQRAWAQRQTGFVRTC